MQVAIVYDSRTGTTKGAAEKMAEVVSAKGHDCTVTPVQAADTAQVDDADAVVIGSWTEGLFFFRQHATAATMDFIDRLEVEHKPAAVFCTYKTAVGKMLVNMTHALEARGADVGGQFKVRSAAVPEGFAEWVDRLG